MKAPWAAACALGSVLAAVAGLSLAGRVADDTAADFVRVLSGVWCATGIAQLALVAAHERLGLGRLVHVMLVVAVGGSCATGVLAVAARAGGAPPLVAAAAVWLVLLVAMLVEFGARGARPAGGARSGQP